MKIRFCSFLSIIAAVAFLGSPAWAQSSGSFTYGSSGQTTDCVLNSNGTITGGNECFQGSCLTNSDCSGISGAICEGATSTSLGVCAIPCSNNKDCSSAGLVGSTCSASTPGGVSGDFCTTVCNGQFNAGIKTNSGNGNVFDVRPSAVIGLLTDVSLAKNNNISIGTSSALAGVDFTVTSSLAGASSQPNTCITPNFPVTYDSRFVQISSNLFNVLSTQCTTTTGCFFSFAESTVSAHSFDWIIGSPATGQSNCVGLQSGTYTISASWAASLGNSGLSQALTCVGPVNVTVEQNKIFSFNTIN